MAEQHLKDNLIYLRSCIVMEVVSKKPVFDCYKHFCGILGDIVMEYQEFEFWFMKFLRGEMDLEYNRSHDPKYRRFSDLPDKILDAIFKKVNLKEIYAIGNISKTLRSAISNVNFNFKTASLKLGYANVEMEVDSEEIYKTKVSEYSEEHGIDAHEIERHIDQFQNFLKHPNLNFEKCHLEVTASTDGNKAVWTKLLDLVRKIGPVVTSVKIRSSEEFLEILDLIYPEEIQIDEEKCWNFQEEVETFYSKISKTEQWKKAKSFKNFAMMEDVDWEYFKGFEILEFEDFELGIWGVGELIKIITNSSNFKKCRIKTRSLSHFWRTTNFEKFQKNLGWETTMISEDTRNAQFLLKNGDKKFDIELSGKNLEIERKY